MSQVHLPAAASSQHAVSIALAGHLAIRERLKALETDLDEETLADTLEGLTDLHEILAAVTRAAVTDAAMAEGLKGHIENLRQRFQRLVDRADQRRKLVREAMLEADIKKIVAPDLTLSIRPGTPSVVVIDETAIPDPYWQPREPRLDRMGLLADLKRGCTVAGAELSNAEPVLSVRVK